ncbi:MAG: transporter substrate-binding domain-containing protein [Alphaproteobacteria bacterium]|nr:transporter substrate-binding domain-containing protein [Alphaproteobacteria bacterium]
MSAIPSRRPFMAWSVAMAGILFVALGAVPSARADGPASSGAPLVIAIDFPPYVNRDGGNGGPGYVRKFMDVALARAGLGPAMDILPIARTLASLQSRPNVIAFPLSMRADRAGKLAWIEPLTQMQTGFVTVGRAVDSLGEARALARVGVTTNSSWEAALRDLGFDNLSPGPHIESNVRRLAAGRIDALFNPIEEVEHLWRQLRLAQQLVRGKPIKSIDLWLVASEGTDPALVARLGAVARELLAEGAMRPAAADAIAALAAAGPARSGQGGERQAMGQAGAQAALRR